MNTVTTFELAQDFDTSSYIDRSDKIEDLQKVLGDARVVRFDTEKKVTFSPEAQERLNKEKKALENEFKDKDKKYNITEWQKIGGQHDKCLVFNGGKKPWYIENGTLLVLDLISFGWV